MKNCSSIKEYICDYIDGTLSKEELDIVQSHLSRCEMCRKEFEEIHVLVGMCSNLEHVEMPDNFKNQLFERISKNQKQYAKNAFSKIINNNVIKAASIVLVAGVLVYSSYMALLLNNSRNLKYDNADNSEQAKMFSVPEAHTRQQQDIQAEEPEVILSMKVNDDFEFIAPTNISIFASDEKQAEKYKQIIIEMLKDKEQEIQGFNERDESKDKEIANAPHENKKGVQQQVYSFFSVSFTSLDEKNSFLGKMREKIGQDVINIEHDNDSLNINLIIDIKDK